MLHQGRWRCDLHGPKSLVCTLGQRDGIVLETLRTSVPGGIDLERADDILEVRVYSAEVLFKQHRSSLTQIARGLNIVPELVPEIEEGSRAHETVGRSGSRRPPAASSPCTVAQPDAVIVDGERS